jgi:ceramide glucosyltransferase
LAAARSVQQRFPDVSSRIVWSAANVAVSPKLNNIWMPVAQARDDLILTKDSNVLLAPGDVECFVRQFETGVGLVSTIPVVCEPKSPAAWIEASIINCYYARMLMLARAVGLGFGCGKIMLFRRSDIERAGGFQSFAWALGEDAALANAVAHLGLRTVLADRVTRQPLGVRSLKNVWERQLRWKAIWRVQVPAIFIAALFGSALLVALAGAAAAPLMGLSPVTVAAATLGLWCMLETLLCLLKGWPVSLWSPVAFVGREILDLLVLLRALAVSEVRWAGETYRLGKPDRTARFAAEMTPALQQEASINDGL